MKKRANLIPRLLILLCLLPACARKTTEMAVVAVEAAPKPAWVQQRPVEPGQYIGIGVARKNPFNPSEHLEAARKQALSDIAMQIKVKVDANSTQSQFEDKQTFTEEFRSFTRTIAQAELEECQLVDTWQNEQEYWVYYRLSQEEYRRARARKIQLAVEQAVGHLQMAQQSASRAQVVAGFDYCLRALDRLAPFAGESLHYTDGGASRSLLVDLADLMLRLSRQTRIEFGVKQLRVKTAHIPADLAIQVRYPGSDGAGVGGFPLKLRYTTPEATNVWKMNTDPDGRVVLRTGVVPSSGNRLLALRAEMDVDVLALDAPHWRWLSLLPPAQRPAAELPVEVTPATIALLVNCTGEQSGWSPAAVVQLMGSMLGKSGMVVHEGKGKPDFQLKLQLDCRTIPAPGGLSTAVLTGTVGVLDAGGLSRFQQGIPEMRISGPDAPAASRAAHKRLLENLELSVIPRMLERILQGAGD